MKSPGVPTSLRIDPALYAAVRHLVQDKRKRRQVATIKAEIEAALSRHISVERSGMDAETLAPAIVSVLEERIERLEHRLAAIMVKTGLDASTAMYLLLYALNETNRLLQAVQPAADATPFIDVSEWYDRARTRAVRHFRDKDPQLLQGLDPNAPPKGGDT